MRTALVYDYLPGGGGGGERVLNELISHFEKDVHVYFGFVVDSPFSRNFLKELRAKIGSERVHTGPTLKILKSLTFRIMNFFLPAFLHQMDFSSYDLVISYTAFLAQAIVPPEKGKHIVYMNTPARFLWNLSHAESFLKTLATPFHITDLMRYRSQLYDLDGIARAKTILAISKAVAERITTFYNREALVLYPASIPDELPKTIFDTTALQNELGEYYVHVSRVESYKNLSLLVTLASEHRTRENIIIMGSGPYLNALRQEIRRKVSRTKQPIYIESLGIKGEKYSNIILTGFIDEGKKMQVLAGASASFSLNDEDFGITKVESIAVGTPVIGLSAGATPEIITEGKNGILFSKPTTDDLNEAIQRHKLVTYDKTAIRKTATKFTTTQFHTNLWRIVNA